MPSRTFRWLSAAALAATVPGGCILLVDDPGDLSGTCRIQSSTGACGDCVRSRCQSALDACCGDPECHPTLAEVDACVTGASPEACPTLRKAGAAGTTAARVRACVEERCAPVCRSTTPPRLKSACRETSDGRCECTLDSTPNQSTCNVAENPLRTCCAQKGWPASNLKCTCASYGCTKTGAGCECAYGRTYGERTCTGRHCCYSSTKGTCRCSDVPCGSSDVAVTDCSEGIECINESTRVQACEVHEDVVTNFGPQCTPFQDGCRCTTERGKPPSGTCTPRTTGTNSICCASTEWPSGGTCTCRPFTCSRGFERCECGVGLEKSDATYCLGGTSGWTCCRRPDEQRCYCERGSGCYRGEEEVTDRRECGAAEIGCPTGQVAVSGCSGN